MKDVLGNHLKDKNPSMWKESLTWIVPRIRSVAGENLEG